MAADPKILNTIHEKVAQAYLALLVQMEGLCPHCQGEIHQPINTAVLGHINKFLAENNIEALAVPESPLAKLQGRLHLIKDYLEPHEREAAGE
jgi:hypothetical protein